MYRTKGNGWLKHYDFMLLDCLWLITSLFLAYFIRMGDLPSFFDDDYYVTLLILYPLTHMFLVFLYGAYRGILHRGIWKEIKSTVFHNTLILMIQVLFMFLGHHSNIYSRIVICLTAVFSTVLMFLSRIINKKVILDKRTKTLNANIKLLIMSDSANIDSTVATVLKNNFMATNICGIIVCDKDMIGQEIKGIPVIASGDTWKSYIVSNVVDEIMINLSNSGEVGDFISYINSVGATAHYVLPINEITSPKKKVQDLNGFTVVSASLNTVSTRQRFIKRAIDICFGLVGSIVVVLLTVIIGPLIFLEDRGPIFFTQKRVGRNGRIFKIIKFRTMYTDAEERKAELMAQNEMSGQMFKMKDDPRITKIGKFLRRTSIDELPQAFNILFGSMSVVGTRPPTLNEYLNYEPHHKVRLGITPGLTGMWQVSGRSTITDFEEIVKLDEQYIRQWSLSLDFKIILKTFIVVFKREGAE